MTPDSNPPSTPSVPADPLIDEVRRVRERLSAAAGNDPRRLILSLESLKAKYQRRIISVPVRPEKKSA